MAAIEGIRIKNYRALKDISLGKLWNTQHRAPLSPMTAVIGKNGVGKSTIFDAFGFLADCLKGGVEEACDARGRGGFTRIRSQGSNESIEFEIYYKEDRGSRPITYELAIDIDSNSRPYVKLERLRQRRKGQKTGWPFSFLIINEGKGIAWKGEDSGKQIEEADDEVLALFSLIEHIRKGADEEEESRETELVELNDKRRLGIATLG
ncbi:MAG: AAA family ATPase, partial [Synechococcaceae cyanobacterium]